MGQEEKEMKGKTVHDKKQKEAEELGDACQLNKDP